MFGGLNYAAAKEARGSMESTDNNIQLIILPYSAMSFSVIARFIFMYLLYTKKSTNIYSLTFCGLSILSSSIWIPYGLLVDDTPIVVRSAVEILLLSVSGVYIIHNRSRYLPTISSENRPVAV